MSDYTLAVPEEVYERAQRIADENEQTVDTVLIEYLKSLPDPLPSLTVDEQEELGALHHLSDDTLWTIARERMPRDIGERMQTLMSKISLGTITDEEYQEQAEYVERGDRLMLRKSEAMAILTKRGYSVRLEDLPSSHD